MEEVDGKGGGTLDDSYLSSINLAALEDYGCMDGGNRRRKISTKS